MINFLTERDVSLKRVLQLQRWCKKNKLAGAYIECEETGKGFTVKVFARKARTDIFGNRYIPMEYV